MRMPRVEVVFFADDDGSAAVLEWLDGLPTKVRDKFIVRIERLAECGSELRRPLADVLRDGIYELRVRNMRINQNLLERGNRNTQNNDFLPANGVKRCVLCAAFLNLS